MKVSLNWLKDYIDLKAPVAEVAHRLTMAGLEAKVPETVGQDSVMDIEITSNRPDWLSHVGVAREASAVFRKKLKTPVALAGAKLLKSEKIFRIAIENLKLCPYYSAVLVEDVQNIPTPDFMKKRLEALGLRPVNFPVDVTNYVLHEIGQPLHAFDADKIQGDTIYIRPARKGEKLTAIDGRDYELISTDLVIADASGPIAIAGVMGGKTTEVSAKTKNILLESAFFQPVSVRTASRRLNLMSDSSYRFERKVDPAGVNLGRDRAVQLMAEYMSVGKLSKVFKSGKPPVSSKKISLELDFVKKILGIELSANDVTEILKYLGLGVTKKKSALVVDIPSFRPDLLVPVDLIEEIARIYGYDRLPESLPALEPLAKLSESIFSELDQVKRLCVGAGFNEAVNFSLTLKQGLIENVSRNLNLGNPNLSFFEVGRVYGAEGVNKLPDEIWSLGLAMTGKKLLNWKDKGRAVTLFDLKGVIQSLSGELSVSDIHFVESRHPFLADTANLQIRLGLEPVGILGELQSEIRARYDIAEKVFLAEIDLELLFKRRAIKKQFTPFSKYPVVLRDLALLVPKQVKAGALMEQIRHTSGALLKNVELFDVFESDKLPAGIKSLGVTMHFQSEERTLSSDEVNVLQEKILSDLKAQFGAYLR
ncbi:MAG: phenylalanine--tRNA ligase subunit beta [Candidatus Omnitrophica bacterium]|nr:phenylalanine--tRNA ligase subunit beta [Candidatus Omnitrophota bacterium]